MQVQTFNKVGTRDVASGLIVAPPWSNSRWWQEVDTLASGVQARLDIVCASRYKNTERTSQVITDGCYQERVSLRIRRGYNEVFEFNCRKIGNDSHFQVYLTLKQDGGEYLYSIQQNLSAQKKKDKSKLSNFASGR